MGKIKDAIMDVQIQFSDGGREISFEEARDILAERLSSKDEKENNEVQNDESK
jgi:hypothetical protein